MRIALVYNLIHAEEVEAGGVDAVAEYDSEETIAALCAALRAGGHEVSAVEADLDVVERLKGLRGAVDLVFNIAEGPRIECRESLVPMLCELLGLPYTGSGPLSLALCRDKPRAKEVLHANGLRTPRFQRMLRPDAPLRDDLRYPLICKLAAEGSSMGLDVDSVVADEASLRRKLGGLVERFPGRGLMVEEFVDGREFTVALVGNAPPVVLPAIEIRFEGTPPGVPKLVLFRPDDDYASVATLLGEHLGELRVVHRQAVCPAEVDDALAEALATSARRAFEVLGCRDWCRMEFRLSAAGELHLLDVNPIAGIDPSYWFPRAARAHGWTYEELISQIVEAAAIRLGL